MNVIIMMMIMNGTQIGVPKLLNLNKFYNILKYSRYNMMINDYMGIQKIIIIIIIPNCTNLISN